MYLFILENQGIGGHSLLRAVALLLGCIHHPATCYQSSPERFQTSLTWYWLPARRRTRQQSLREQAVSVRHFAEGWHSVSDIHISPGTGLSELYRAANLPHLSWPVPYSTLRKKSWPCSSHISLTSQPRSPYFGLILEVSLCLFLTDPFINTLVKSAAIPRQTTDGGLGKYML